MTENCRWYTFENEANDIIIGSTAQKQSNGYQEYLPEHDARVQKWLGPLWVRQTYQEYTINKIEDLLSACNICSSSPKWGFRGHSKYGWSLESALDRDSEFVFKKDLGLARYERQILTEAKRRTHHYFSKTPSDEDTLGWFSFLRHHGTPTRLLDITWSIFIACYFAVISESESDGAIWAFNQFNLNQNLHSTMAQNLKTMFINPERKGYVIDGYQGPTVENNPSTKPVTSKQIFFNLGNNTPTIFDLATLGVFNLEAIVFAEPMWLSRRQDVQQGAFLFHLNCRKNFMDNLRSMIGLSSLSHEKDEKHNNLAQAKKYSRQISQNASVIKFKVPSEMKETLKAYLAKMNLRHNVLFPDFEGTVGMLKQLLPRN